MMAPYPNLLVMPLTASVPNFMIVPQDAQLLYMLKPKKKNPKSLALREAIDVFFDRVSNSASESFLSSLCAGARAVFIYQIPLEGFHVSLLCLNPEIIRILFRLLDLLFPPWRV